MYETPSFEDLFMVFSGKPARRLIYIISDACIVLRDAVFKSLNEPLPSGKLSQGSDPVLRCWWLGSQRLSFYGTPQSLCFPAMRRVKLRRVILEKLSQHNFKREEKSTENNGLRSHLWDTTAVGCHLVDTDIVDLSDLGHDPILIITCGITQSWLDTVISGWTTLTYVYDFDLMTLFLLSNIRNNMTNTVPWLLWLWWNWLPPIVVPTQEFESHMPVFLSNTPSFKWFLARQDEKFSVT